ncbi:214_t:CDS:2, partial [Cetraspora pellucida]
PSFITIEVVDQIIQKNGTLSRYFIQRLHLNFGLYDIELIKEKMLHANLITDNNLSLLNKTTKPWASDLSLPVCFHLLCKANELYGNELCVKGNDMELFHFYSGELVILWKDIGYDCEDVTDLIFQGLSLILFPPNPSMQYVKPTKDIVIEKFKIYINLGFELNISKSITIFYLFENRIDDIGDILILSFSEILKIDKETLLKIIRDDAIKL